MQFWKNDLEPFDFDCKPKTNECPIIQLRPTHIVLPYDVLALIGMTKDTKFARMFAMTCRAMKHRIDQRYGVREWCSTSDFLLPDGTRRPSSIGKFIRARVNFQRDLNLLPVTVTSLLMDFGHRLIPGVVFPISLRVLKFGKYFNQPVDDIKFPEGLESLQFGMSFNQPVNQLQLPMGLKHLVFGQGFNQPCHDLKLPPGLLRLVFGLSFSQIWPSFPESLEHLSMGWSNLPLEELPPRLKRLFLGPGFQQPLHTVRLPPTLELLVLSYSYQRLIHWSDLRLPPACRVRKLYRTTTAFEDTVDHYEEVMREMYSI